LNTFRKAGNGLGVALFGVLITDATVAGIQDASCCLGFCSPLASGIVVTGIQDNSDEDKKWLDRPSSRPLRMK
jgi:hypothetical protein